MKAIRVATINNNDPKGPRVRLELHKTAEGYVWVTAEGEDCGIAPQKSVAAAEEAAYYSWRGPYWRIKATWI